MVDRIIESVEWVDSFAAWSQWLWNEMERLAYEDWHEEQQDAEIELLNQKLEALYGESVDAYRAEAAENRRQIERLVELNEWQARSARGSPSRCGRIAPRDSREPPRTVSRGRNSSAPD